MSYPEVLLGTQQLECECDRTVILNFLYVLIGKKALSAYLKVLLQHSCGQTYKKREKYLKIAGKLAEISTYAFRSTA
jgi:hypothetical protein